MPSKPVVFVRILLLFDRFDRADGSAGAAINTLIGIDDVLFVALGDDAERAAIGAGAALCASVGDVVGHDKILLSK